MADMGEVRKCFIVTPIGPEGSTTRRATDGVIDSVILPVLEELGFDSDVAHRICETGSITKQAIARIINDDLVIANLTELNPNVMYELGIRHSARKPTVHICQSGTILPFDIAPERTLFYTDDMYGIMELRPALKSFIEKVMEDKNPDNPVYQAVEKTSILQSINAEDPIKYIIERLDKLDQNFSTIRNNKNQQSHTKRGAIVSVAIKPKNYNMNTVRNIVEQVSKEFRVDAPDFNLEEKDGELVAVFDKDGIYDIELFRELSKRLNVN